MIGENKQLKPWHRAGQRRQVKSVRAQIGLPNRSMDLHYATLEGFRFEVIEHLSKMAGVELNEVVAAIGLSNAILKKRQVSGRLTPHESDKVYRLVRLYEETLRLFEGDGNAARSWLRSTAVALGGEAPARYIRTTSEFEAALDLIGQLENGVVV